MIPAEKISVGIRLDQIPETCSTRNELVKFIDNYVCGRKTNGLFVPRDEYKFHLGFAPETGQILLFPEMMIRDGFVQTDRFVLSDIMKEDRTIEELEWYIDAKKNAEFSKKIERT